MTTPRPWRDTVTGLSPAGSLPLQAARYTNPYLRNNGVEPVVLPPKSPNLNAHCERFIRSIKEEVLDRMIFTGEASLRYAIRCYLNHYHAERHHQGLDNELITPEPEVGRTTGRGKRRAHLGGLLSYYHREAA